MSQAADNKPSFVLASSSPRRRRLLASAGLSFEVDPSNLSERPKEGESPTHYVRRMASDKAREVGQRRRSGGDTRPILAADTIVVVDGRIIEKPHDRDEAQEMLEILSGRAHYVITAFCIIDPRGDDHLEDVTTEVLFKRLRPDEIQAYLDTDEWRDKAGGYAVQGGAAYMVRSVMGSYTNVVGLPLCQAVEALGEALR